MIHLGELWTMEATKDEEEEDKLEKLEKVEDEVVSKRRKTKRKGRGEEKDEVIEKNNLCG